MSVGPCTPEQEALYKLRPLPDVPFIGTKESQRRRANWERHRVGYREVVPIIEAVEIGDLNTASTRTTKT